MNKVILSSVIDLISGGTPKTNIPEYWDGDIGWLSVTDFNNDLRYVYESEKSITKLGVENSNTKFLEIGDIIISARGTVGAMSQIGFPMCFNQSCFGIRGKKEIVTTDYLYYALKNYINNIIKRSQGSVFNTINLATFDLMEIEIHDTILEQCKVTKILSDLDEKIELNNKINTELEAMAKVIYNYWFLQFDFPDANGKPYKSSGGKMIYNEILKRKIPENWNVANLKNNSLSKIIIPKVCEFEGKKIYLSTSDVKENNINFKAQNISFSKRPSRANMQPEINSVWFAKMKNSKKVLYFGDYSDELLDHLILSTGFAGLKCKKNSLEYVWEFINNIRFEHTKDRLSVGATQEAINNDAMSLIPFLEPTNEVLEKYQASVKKIYMKIYNNQIENKFLCDLGEWLLPMLMNGQVKIK